MSTRTLIEQFAKIAALTLGVGSAAHAWQAEPSDVSFANADGLSLPGKLFVPQDAAVQQPLPAVVMLHGCSGIYSRLSNGTYTTNIAKIYREWADRLTAAGYAVLLVDSFTPRGSQYECNNGAGVGISEVLDRPKDALGAYQYLAAQTDLIDADRIGLLGWSHGGSATLATLATTLATDGVTPSSSAATKPFKVGVAFYPGCGLSYDDNGVLKTGWTSITYSKWDSYAPLLINHGSADKLYYNSSKSTTALQYPCTTRVNKAAQIAGGAAVALTVYPDAAHSFDDPSSGQCDTLDPSATPDACAKKDADQASLNMLNQYLQPATP
ncbi:MAG: dienelactone hydrolase family protein [Gammaproteobacteria bacterium]